MAKKSKPKNTLDKLIEHGLLDDDALKADGFDDCVLGATHDGRIIYDYAKMIKKLQEDGMSYEEAIEFFDFNISGSILECGPEYMIKP